MKRMMGETKKKNKEKSLICASKRPECYDLAIKQMKTYHKCRPCKESFCRLVNWRKGSKKQMHSCSKHNTRAWPFGPQDFGSS